LFLKIKYLDIIINNNNNNNYSTKLAVMLISPHFLKNQLEKKTRFDKTPMCQAAKKKYNLKSYQCIKKGPFGGQFMYILQKKN
jgi:hypothetical protein